MLRVVIVSALLALAHGSKESHDISSSEEEVVEEQGHCPIDVSSNSSLTTCPTSCTNGTDGTNCTTLDCSSDANCTGLQKCCKTSCGLKCVDPVYRMICSVDEDCAEHLICCRKSCVSVCVTPKPAKKNGKGGKARGRH
ncbi:uncharacterized protein O3C94_018065 [Discoglossus pictus]